MALRSKPIALSHLECRALEALFQAQGQIVDTDRLSAIIWPEANVSATSLRALIGRLRQKLGPDCIETIGGEGYRWVGRNGDHTFGGRIQH